MPPPRIEVAKDVAGLNCDTAEPSLKTRGDGFVEMSEQKAPCTGGGDIGNWARVRHVLPGHGPAGGAEIVEGQKRFFTGARPH